MICGVGDHSDRHPRPVFWSFVLSALSLSGLDANQLSNSALSLSGLDANQLCNPKSKIQNPKSKDADSFSTFRGRSLYTSIERR